MTQQFIQKNLELSLEFDDYLAKHPEIYDKIPQGAVVIVTSGTDQRLRDASIKYAKRYPENQTLVEACKYASKWVLRPLNLPIAA